MADLTEAQSSSSTKIVGSSSTGDESNYVDVTGNQELEVADRLDNGGEDTVIAVTAGTPVEVYVSGGANRTDRKQVMIQADAKIKFGFSAGTQSFTGFKDQMIAFSIGENTSIWIDAFAGTANVAVGELS